MGLRINGNADPSDGIRRTQEALTKTLRQIGSAKRITQAGDDAAGLAISENLRAAERAFQQGVRNLSDGVSVARTADAAIGTSSELVSRMRELTVQAGNGTLSETAQGAIQSEFDALAEELTRVTGATEFNGQKLLNGDTSGSGAVTLRDGTGGDDVVQISIQDLSAEALGVDNLDVTDGATLDALDMALNTLAGARGELGAVESRLQSGIDNLESIRENTAAANSRIADVDIAEATADLAKSQILEQMQVSVQAQANISASMALSLLR